MIEVEDVHRRFGDLWALKGVSFSVPEGSICGFIGPNGAGKTTTMRILATLDLPSSGQAKVGGFDTSTEPDRVRSVLGYMPDHYGAYDGLNVAEYLEFFARAYALDRRQRLRRTEEIINFTEIEPLLQQPVSGLSKGQKQRLSLARALLPDPKVMLLDEPAAGLDPRARIELRELLKALAKNGKTILISSHILTELSDLIDRVVMLVQGQLKFEGTLRAFGEQNQNSSGSEGVAVYEVHLASDAAQARRFFLAQREVVEVGGADDVLSLSLRPDSDSIAELMARAMAEGLRFHEYFLNRAQHLEDAFLAATAEPDEGAGPGNGGAVPVEAGHGPRAAAKVPPSTAAVARVSEEGAPE